MNVSENLPLVSIVTPVYNGSAFLEELILSVIAQDYPRIEHIIIDDGSTDNCATVSILKKYQTVKWWSRPNKGQCPTIVEGFLAAQGAVITTINADDFYCSPTAISEAVSALQASPDKDGVYGITIMGDEHGASCPVQPPKSMPDWTLPYYLFIANCSLFLKAPVLQQEKILPDASLKYRWDREWILRIQASGKKLRHVAVPIAIFRYHASQLSQSTARSILNLEDKTIDEKYSVNLIVKKMVRDYIVMRHRVLMFIFVMQQEGLFSACRTFQVWLTRSRG